MRLARRVAAAALGALGVFVLAYALLVPTEMEVEHDNPAVVGGSSVTVYTIDCGSAIYGGPDDFTSGGVWLIDPCAEVVRDRRLLAGAGFVVAVGSVALFATARPPREGPTVGRG